MDMRIWPSLGFRRNSILIRYNCFHHRQFDYHGLSVYSLSHINLSDGVTPQFTQNSKYKSYTLSVKISSTHSNRFKKQITTLTISTNTYTSTQCYRRQPSATEETVYTTKIYCIKYILKSQNKYQEVGSLIAIAHKQRMRSLYEHQYSLHTYLIKNVPFFFITIKSQRYF